MTPCRLMGIDVTCSKPEACGIGCHPSFALSLPKAQPGEKADTCALVSRGFCNRTAPSLFEMEFWDPELSYGNFENTHEVPENPTF